MRGEAAVDHHRAGQGRSETNWRTAGADGQQAEAGCGTEGRVMPLLSDTSETYLDECAHALTTESHRVIEGKRGIRLSAFGWFVVATLGGSIALVAVSLAIHSMRRFL